MPANLTKLRRIDMTLLIVFRSLLRHRQATAVAEELGLTQSAVSHSLKRLRDIFGDELFLRKPHGLEPTSVALGLEGPVGSAIDTLKAALDGPAPFTPERAAGIVRIGAFDGEQATLMPDLIRMVAAEAPGLTISVHAIGRRDAMDALADGKLDLAIGFFWDVDAALIAEDLYRENYRVVGKDLSLDRDCVVGMDHYLSREHILVSPAGDVRGIVDTQLAERGLKRRVVAALPLFLPAMATAAKTDAIATVPARIASAFADGFGLTQGLPPVEIRSFPVSVLFHRRDVHNALLAWIIGRLRQVVADQSPA